jgi:hypothetical protein
MGKCVLVAGFDNPRDITHAAYISKRLSDQESAENQD